MKLALFLTFAISSSVYSQAPGLIISPNGIINAFDTSKHFVVIHIDTVSAKELYNRSYDYILHTWKNPEIANSGKVEGEFLHVNTFVKAAFIYIAGLAKYGIDIKYSLNLDFKDGKIKYEIKDLDMSGHSGDGTPFEYYLLSPGGFANAMYSKSGELKGSQESAKKELEAFFNEQLKSFITAVSVPVAKQNF